MRAPVRVLVWLLDSSSSMIARAACSMLLGTPRPAAMSSALLCPTAPHSSLGRIHLSSTAHTVHLNSQPSAVDSRPQGVNSPGVREGGGLELCVVAGEEGEPGRVPQPCHQRRCKRRPFRGVCATAHLLPPDQARCVTFMIYIAVSAAIRYIYVTVTVSRGSSSGRSRPATRSAAIRYIYVAVTVTGNARPSQGTLELATDTAESSAKPLSSPLVTQKLDSSIEFFTGVVCPC
eukprot:1176871-Prorocentrum_minimum.AAC.1